MGAYEAALKYSQERLQFGRPIGSFQLIQGPSGPDDRKHHGLSQCLIVRQAQLYAEGKLSDAHAALSKRSALPSVVRPSRGPEKSSRVTHCGHYQVARFFNDCEALYTYEGTFQMQNLIVAKP